MKNMVCPTQHRKKSTGPIFFFDDLMNLGFTNQRAIVSGASFNACVTPGCFWLKCIFLYHFVTFCNICYKRRIPPYSMLAVYNPQYIAIILLSNRIVSHQKGNSLCQRALFVFVIICLISFDFVIYHAFSYHLAFINSSYLCQQVVTASNRGW